MKCKNSINVKGISGYENVSISCGFTGPNGVVELCPTCKKIAEKNYPQGWRYYPGDTCKHGTYLDPRYDCQCTSCEAE